MPIRTRRWDDPPNSDEGLRILVTRYRPRGLPKSAETWDVWIPQLAPSKELHAAAYAKTGSGISWETYRAKYLKEMAREATRVDELAKRLANGETLTLLCSSQCDRESRCHRSLLKGLIEDAAATIRPA